MTCKSFRRPLDAGEISSESPTSACFDCGAVVAIAEAWQSSRNPEIALCESCFRRREANGRARQAPPPSR